MAHPCPIKNCTVMMLPDQLLMCRKHWRMMPRALQDRVISTWNEYQASREHKDLAKYRAARDEAFAVVEAAIEARAV